MIPHIGIDFGTTKTLVSFINPNTDHPELIRLGRSSDILPTTAYFHADGHLDFGDDADDMIEDLDGSYIRGFKMELGSTTPLHMFIDQGKIHNVCASDLVSKFLRYIRLRVQEEVFFGKPVTWATITHPVSFSPAQCEELRQAALAAGFTRVNFTTEPEAAALAFCRLEATQAFKKSALIVDWGGGTLDLALVTRSGNGIKIHRNLVAGDMEIGGEKFDEALWNHVAAELHQQGVTTINRVALLPTVRTGKEQLSGRDNVTLHLSHSGGISPVSLSRADFNRLIHAHVEKACGIVQSLLARIPTEDKPEMLILVGGSSSIPLIKEKLEKACGLPAHKWHYSRQAVAFGAAMWNKEEAAPAAPPQEDEVAPGKQEQQYDEANEEENDAPLPVQAAELEQTAESDTSPGDYKESDENEEAIPHLRQEAEQGNEVEQPLLNEQQQHMMQAYPQSPQEAENTQQTQQTGNTRLVSGSTYFFLAIFLGFLGVHNFYAKRHSVAIIQLLLSIVSGLSLSLLLWIWAIIETFIVNKDGENIPFEDAEKSIPTQIKKKAKETLGRK